MWFSRILQRSGRPHSTWRRSFSLTTFLHESFSNKRSIYYPTEQIKNLEDFRKFASPEEKQHLERITSEYYALCKRSPEDVPEMSDEDWLIHMNYETKLGRASHLNLIRTKQNRKAASKRKLADKPVVAKEEDPKVSHQFTISMAKQKLIIRNRVAQAMMLEEPILVDLGFASSMFYNEITDVARHLVQTLGTVNKSAFEPWPTLRVIFCNAKPSIEENEIIKVFRRLTVGENSFDKLPVTITESSYLDLYKARELVYLTQDADIYYHPTEGIPIIGAIINKTTKDKLPIQRAYDDDIKVRKLPIDLNEKVYDRKMTVAHVIEYVAMLRFTWDPSKARTTLQNRVVSPRRSQR